MKKVYLAICLIGVFTLLQSNKTKTQFSHSDHITAGSTNIIIEHDVADFKKWKVAFDADADRRSKAGFTDLLVTHENENTNHIAVVLGVNDMEKCKSFFSDPKTAELMGAAGATSPPSFTYFNAAESSITEGHSYMIIQHDVKDYDAWKTAFDLHESVREDYSISVTAAGSTLDNPNHVLAILNTRKAKNFSNFLENSNLKEAMKEAGIASEPQQIILSEVK